MQRSPRSFEPRRSSVYQRHAVSAQPARRGFRVHKRVLFFGILSIFCVWMFVSRLTHADSKVPVAQVYTKKQTVCIDPGHGGADPGALSTDGTISERSINLTVALKVRDLLNAKGYQVFMTRTTNDVSMDNYARYTFCNAKHATVMVSIHHNFFDDETVDYTTDLFYKAIDQGLATTIASATATKLNIPNNGIAQFEDGVLSKSVMPAAVSEGFFITNADESVLMSKTGSTRLVTEAQGIAEGIDTYLTHPAAANAAVDSTTTSVLNRAGD